MKLLFINNKVLLSSSPAEHLMFASGFAVRSMFGFHRDVCCLVPQVLQQCGFVDAQCLCLTDLPAAGTTRLCSTETPFCPTTSLLT